jgi:hypothetical protein
LLIPYDFTVIDNGYEFTTSNALTYSVYFIDVTETFNSEVNVFSFGFGIEGYHGEIPQDGRVGQTIAKILDDFFLRYDDIILYVPSESDGKEKERLRLFDIWWTSYKPYFQCDNLEMDRVEFKYQGNKDFIVTVFYKVPQRESARKILYDALPEIWARSK